MLRKSLALIALLTGSFLLNGCEATDQDKIGDAQICLDHASSSTAAACVTALSGIQSADSYIIRCSADFITEGFTDPSRLSNALNQIQGSNGTTALLAALVFHTVDSSTMFSDCNKSQQKGLQMIASMAKTATDLATLSKNLSISGSYSGTISTADIQSAISTLQSSPTAQAAVGTSIQTVYQSTCATGSQANQDMCTQINSAFTSQNISPTTSTPAQIGAALLNYWNTHQ